MDSLPVESPVLAVCAHPDDESFGLGATLAALAGYGARTAVLCFTHGAASALGSGRGDLHQIRAAELAAAGS
jgi:LmbE family N-acetylglucosaminyl deacetylase